MKVKEKICLIFRAESDANKFDFMNSFLIIRSTKILKKVFLLFILIQSTILGLTQIISPEPSKNLRFAHFVGTYCRLPAKLEVVYDKKTGVVQSLYFYSLRLSHQPLGLEPGYLIFKGNNLVSKIQPNKTYSIVDWITFYKDNKLNIKFNSKSYAIDLRRYSDLLSRSLYIQGIFKNNYSKFEGKMGWDTLGLEPILLARDTVNEEVYGKELKIFYKTIHQNYPDKKILFKSITYIDSSLLCGIFQFGKSKGDDSKLKAFTFLRNRNKLLNDTKLFVTKIIDSFPTENAKLNNFFLTNSGVVFFWMGERYPSETYYHYGTQYFVSYDKLYKNAWLKRPIVLL